MSRFDCAIIGGGPGGYVAAIRLAQLGKKVVLIERHSQLGGTCTHVGCIPSKALLDSSERFIEAKKHFKTHGISTSDLSYDWTTMLGRKAKVVKLTAMGIGKLMEKNEITVLTGRASFLSPHELSVEPEESGSSDPTKKCSVEADHIIIATGSKPMDLPFCRFDKKQIISSTEALSLETFPARLLVIGAGVIGLELGSIYARLGSKVTVLEALDRCIPTMDSSLGVELAKPLKRLGMKLHLSTRVEEVTTTDESVHLKATDSKGRALDLEADVCLLAIGRRPNTKGLQLEAAGLELDERGFLKVNASGQTAQEHIWGIGDVIGGAMLAHKAEEEGVAVAMRIAGGTGHVDPLLIPGVVYTWPEVASVGKTEEELVEGAVDFKSGQFPFMALGRARAAGEKDGFVKVLACAKTDRLLGVHMIGPRVADMIGHAATALQYEATAAGIGDSCQAHPTFSEAFKEACLAATDDRALHL
jgi:dihydrolipoamide dehydrogenase